jgi:hypothetical protein
MRAFKMTREGEAMIGEEENEVSRISYRSTCALSIHPQSQLPNRSYGH